MKEVLFHVGMLCLTMLIGSLAKQIALKPSIGSFNKMSSSLTFVNAIYFAFNDRQGWLESSFPTN